MLDIKIVLDERADYTGQITLFFNNGGIQGAKIINSKVLTVLKLTDSVAPIKSISDCPTST